MLIWTNIKSMPSYEGYSPLILLPKEKQEMENGSSALSQKAKDAQVHSPGDDLPMM